MAFEPFVVTEGVEGYWYFHLSKPDKFTVSLCGRRTMQTGITRDFWGSVCGNKSIRYKWCEECAKLAGGVNVPRSDA